MTWPEEIQMADFKRLPDVGIFKIKGLFRRQVEKVKKEE